MEMSEKEMKYNFQVPCFHSWRGGHAVMVTDSRGNLLLRAMGVVDNWSKRY